MVRSVNDVDIKLRIAVAGLVLLGISSSLLGVLVGWALRGREVRELETKIEVLRESLAKAWGKKVTRIRARENKPLNERLECGARYFGDDELARWMKCSRPKGHYESDKDGTRHGYAGVFWGEGK